ncbi:MAG: hypothetical protein WDN04_01550 [Rhodospirillales bacterium]
MTNELNVGHYFKRLTMIDSTLGDARLPPCQGGRRHPCRARMIAGAHDGDQVLL